MTIASHARPRGVSRRLGLTQRMLAAEESRASGLGDVRSMLRTILVVSAIVEVGNRLRSSFPASSLPRLQRAATRRGTRSSTASRRSTTPDSCPRRTASPRSPRDVWVRAPIALGVFIGALGFPVYLNLIRRWRRPRDWSLHTKLTLVMVFVLTGISTLSIALLEWNNPATLGQHSVLDAPVGDLLHRDQPDDRAGSPRSRPRRDARAHVARRGRPDVHRRRLGRHRGRDSGDDLRRAASSRSSPRFGVDATSRRSASASAPRSCVWPSR